MRAVQGELQSCILAGRHIAVILSDGVPCLTKYAQLRKMKCDSNPNGCAHCRDATEVCFQVDRVTKARVARGEIERTKRQNEELLRENNALKIQQQHFLHEIQKLTLELRNLRGDSHTGDGAQPKRDETAFSSHSGVSQRQPFPPCKLGTVHLFDY